MADAIFMYSVTTGVFAFLVAILFASRGARGRHGQEKEAAESQSSAGKLSGEGRRINSSPMARRCTTS